MANQISPGSNPPTRRRRHIWAWVLGVVGIAVVAVIALWDWDWFLPLVEAQASSALGRKVTAQHLHVALGRTVTVSLDGVEVAGVPTLANGKPFADIDKLTVAVDAMAYVRSRQLVIPQITVDHPVIEADQNLQGEANWPSGSSSSSSSKPSNPSSPGPQIGNLVINNGQAHVALAKLKADFGVNAATQAGNASGNASSGTSEGQQGDGQQIVADAKGTYAAQPITARFTGGALLSLRDKSHPYPIDLHLANGATRVSLTGTVENPLNFAGANLTLQFAGPNMAQLTPLTGVPIPETPPFSVTGKLNYADRKVQFNDFHGRLGDSDLNGDIAGDPSRSPRPLVEATLSSHRVNLADLGGFIGTTPGQKGDQNAGQRAAVEHKQASTDKVLPQTPVNLPKLNFADVHLHYKGEHIEGRSVPLDNIVANLNIDDGRIQLQPLSFAVGGGDIALHADLAPVNAHDVKANARIDLQHVSLARLLAATHMVEGAGTLTGNAEINSTGDSLASLLGHGNGGVAMGMSGGNLSALLVDIAGLEVGNAILSALGVPQRANLQCFVAEYTLTNGVLGTKDLIVDTSEAVVRGTGNINLANETLDYKLVTRSKHFSIGTLSTPIDITGTLKSPSIRPEVGPLALKGGAAVGLGVLFPPAALLPTIQFGTGNTGDCQAAEAPVSKGETATQVVQPHAASTAATKR